VRCDPQEASRERQTRWSDTVRAESDPASGVFLRFRAKRSTGLPSRAVSAAPAQWVGGVRSGQLGNFRGNDPVRPLQSRARDRTEPAKGNAGRLAGKSASCGATSQSTRSGRVHDKIVATPLARMPVRNLSLDLDISGVEAVWRYTQPSP